MSEPKYDEDLVNLGYLKRAISDTEEAINIDFNNVSRHYGSQPIPPYYEGDTWVDGDIVYTCINTRLVGSYTAADWTTESGALQKAESKNRVFLTQPSNYKPGDMWILQSDNDHRAGTRGEMLISTAGRAVYDSDDWVNMLGYGTIRSINEVAGNLNAAITRIGVVEDAIEDGLIITFYQASVPEGVHIGDLWYVTGTVTGYTQGKIYRYNGSTWDLLNDPAIQQAFTEANEARLVADGKIQSFYSASAPTTGDIGVGDLWIDTDDNNKLYRYNGTNWVACYDTRIDDVVETVSETTERVTTIETDLGEIDMTVSQTTTRLTTVEGRVDTLTDTTGQAEGKTIYIDDSSDNTIISAKFDGETSQATRSGINLYEPLPNNTVNTVSLTYNSDGSYTINGTSTTAFNFEISSRELEAGNYTLQCKYTGTLPSNSNARVQVYSASGFFSIGNNAANDAVAQKAYSNNLTDVRYRIRIEANFNYQNVKIYPLLVKGTYTAQTMPAFEPYGVMPSPGYPSEIVNLKTKNLLKNIDSSQTVNGITFTLNQDKTITLNGTATANALLTIYGEWSGTTIYQKLDNSKYYTISGSSDSNIQVFIRTTNGSTISSHNPQSSSTFTGQIGIVNYFIQVLSGTVCNNITIKPQLEEGSVATEYVPYNNLEIKAVNKNIFNKNVIAKTNGATKTVIDTGVRATITNAGNFRYFGIEIGQSELLGKTITISSTITPSSNNNGCVTLYWGNSSSMAVTGTGITITETGSYTGTLASNFPTNCDRLYALIYGNRNGTGNVNDYVDYTNLQVEIGTGTTYEEHKEQVVYFPLEEGQKLMQGSYLADDGIHNVRKQVIFDGTENWSFSVSGDNYNAFTLSISDLKSNSTILSDLFSQTTYRNVNNEGIGVSTNSAIVSISISNTLATNKATFQTWLSNNNTTVEYELVAEEIITYNTDQQAAWNSIMELMTYKNVTNIYSDAYAHIGYVKDNGLDIYETKHDASRKYIETIEKFAEQQITNESIIGTVSQTITTVSNNYNELKTQFNDYAPVGDVVSLQNSVQEIQTSTYTKTEINEKLTDGSVTKVSTTAGTFDNNGLTIEKTDAKTKGNFNERGVTVFDATSGTNKELLFAGYDENLNETIVRTNNLTVEKYFTLENTSRKERYVNPVLGGHGEGTFIL